VERER
jgi:hypothetical protein